MKIYLKFFAIPLLIAFLASCLYIMDSLVANLFISNTSFMWVGFAIWTIFYNCKLKERLTSIASITIGFVVATLMMLITNSFSLKLLSISVSGILAVFLMNFLVMFIDKVDKRWANPITGVFTGIFLTFSGLGIGINPLASTNDFFTTASILLIYTILGLTCGFVSISVTNKVNKKLSII